MKEQIARFYWRDPGNWFFYVRGNKRYQKAMLEKARLFVPELAYFEERKMSELTDKIVVFKRQDLKNLLAECTEAQQAHFSKIYGRVDQLGEKVVEQAIHLCERTLRHNTEEKIT